MAHGRSAIPLIVGQTKVGTDLSPHSTARYNFSEAAGWLQASAYYCCRIDG